MSKITLLEYITRSTNYPISAEISAPYNCGTISITLDGEWTDEMIAQLPSINLKIYKGTQVFNSFGINIDTVSDWKANHPTEPYSIPIYDIPSTADFSITPLFDNYAITAHNEMENNGIVESINTDGSIVTTDNKIIWTKTDLFNLTIAFDNDSISSGSGGSGGGGVTPGRASKVSFDPIGTILTSTNVQDAIIELLGKTTTNYTVSTTLYSNGWNSKQYTIQDNNIKLNSYIYIDIPDNLTQEQYNEVASANLVCTNQTVGAITIKAYGDVPNIDIPITIIIQNKN